MTRVLIALLVGSLVTGALAAEPGAGATPGEPGLRDRLRVLAAAPDRTLHYREVRDGGLFSGPVEYTGRLQYRPETGELLQWVDSPAAARLAVTGQYAEIETGEGRVRRLALDSRPDLAGMMTGLRALLAGDAAALERVFVADYLEADDGSWVIHLKPRNEALIEHLALLEIRGKNDRVAAVEQVDADGRRRVMDIVPADED